MSESTESQDLSPDEAAAKIESGEVQLVDVRRDHEYEAGHLEGAVHIPLDDLPARAGELDGNKAILFHCRTGSRSAMATDAFRASGVEAYNLGGGLERWVDEGGALSPPGGTVAPSARPDNS